MLLRKFMLHQRRAYEPLLIGSPTRKWEVEADTIVPKAPSFAASLTPPSSEQALKPPFLTEKLCPAHLLRDALRRRLPSGARRGSGHVESQPTLLTPGPSRDCGSIGHLWFGVPVFHFTPWAFDLILHIQQLASPF